MNEIRKKQQKRTINKNSVVTITHKNGFVMDGKVKSIERLDENNNFRLVIDCFYT